MNCLIRLLLILVFHKAQLLVPLVTVFILYPVGDIARHHQVNYHVYADNTQLYVSFDPTAPDGLVNALSKLQNCITDIKNWMCVNKLKLNDSKTEFVIAASDYYQRQLPDITLTIGDSCIKPSQTIRNLGAFFDSNMSMAAHITNFGRTITFQKVTKNSFSTYLNHIHTCILLTLWTFSALPILKKYEFIRYCFSLVWDLVLILIRAILEQSINNKMVSKI